MELNTSQPHHSEIVGKPSRNPILYVVIGVVLIIIVALGLLVWQQKQQISDALAQVSDAEKRLSESVQSVKDKSDGIALEDTDMAKKSEEEQKQSAQLAAGEYFCAMSDFGCDKIISNVTKFQKTTQGQDGFAIVTATNSAGKKLTLWLKYRTGGYEWFVFYEGEALPSAAITKQWSIPTDFLAVD